MSNAITAADTLGADINKLDKKGDENVQGVASEKLPELTLDMKDEDLVKLADKWEKIWNDSPAKADWLKQGEENEKYWLGKQFDQPSADKNRPQVDNLIFESLETYLPQVTRRNPEPLVSLDAKEESDDGSVDEAKQKYVNKVKNRLADIADKNSLRLKLKKAARHWAVFLLGVAKLGWDLDKDIPTARVIRAKKLILDPDATIDEDGYTGSRIGEYRKQEASAILKMIELNGGSSEASEKIKEMAKDDEKATEIEFVEWWTPQYMFWKLKDKILFKIKNPHWNWDQQTQEDQVDDYGNATTIPKTIEGVNHFPSPKMPYEFISIFNLGDQPMDKTSLIGQNLANQDLINKRNKQIDKNADRMNGGCVVSLERSGLSKADAKSASEAVRKGGTIVIPAGAPQDAVYFPVVNGLPADIYNNLTDTRSRLRDIFGTSGSTPASIQEEKTVRGKIISRGLDVDRVGGGVSEYLEQFADGIYNWFLQLLYVYDEGFQFIGGAVPPKLNISVKEGSLLPKDSISIANQAIELALANKMALVDLYERLEYPNPEDLAANVWLEANAPQLLYKDNQLVMEAMGIMAAQQAAAQAAKVAEAEVKFNQDKEMEAMKGEQKMNEKMAAEGRGTATPSGSILKEVPQEMMM